MYNNNDAPHQVIGNNIYENQATVLSSFYPPQLGGTIFWLYGRNFVFNSNILSNENTELAIALTTPYSTTIVGGISTPPYTIPATENWWGTPIEAEVRKTFAGLSGRSFDIL